MTPTAVRVPIEDLRKEYSDALRLYLADPGERALFRAASLGRRAMAANLGVLDLVVIHNGCFAAALTQRANGDFRRELEANGIFLAEALSPYEMTHRGFREVSESIQRIIRFAAVVCHELRTPLTSVVNSIGMLAEVLNAGPQTAAGRLLANISQGTDILRARTGDLLDLVGFQSGALSLRPRHTDVGRLLVTASEAMAAECERAKVVVNVERAAGLPAIVADPDRLLQVITNLVQNALKYGADGGRVDLRARTEGDSIIIEVQDYGQGVSMWDRMRIFEPNYRGSNLNHDIPGLGIGLALCAALVQQHHGTISLESEQGKGSLFRITLPLPERR